MGEVNDAQDDGRLACAPSTSSPVLTDERVCVVVYCMKLCWRTTEYHREFSTSLVPTKIS